MKLIAACDGRDPAGFLSALARTANLRDAEVIFAYVIDQTIEEDWQQMAGHHWLGRHRGPRERERFGDAAALSAQEILDEAMSLSADWPAAHRRPIELRGNPERELVRLALAEEAHLLAIGQHRLELGPHALGRVARFVIDHAPCPVLLVRDDALRAAAASLLGNRLDKGPKHPPGRPTRH